MIKYKDIMLKIAGIQFSCLEEKKKNIKKALILAEMAVDEGAKIICFQELYNTNWFPAGEEEKYFSLAEEIPGESTETFCRLAKENEVVIICPVFEKGENGLYYNSAVVINKDGSILGTYRKVHIPSIPLWEEKYYFEPGDLGLPVFKTDYADFGIQLCWDNFFPEASRVLALKGADIIFSPTAAAFKSQEKWEKIICANAIANNIFIFRINRVGEEDHQYFYGKTFCADPYGEIMSEPSALNDSVIISNVDLSLVKSARNEYCYMSDRRVDLYHEIIKENIFNKKKVTLNSVVNAK